MNSPSPSAPPAEAAAPLPDGLKGQVLSEIVVRTLLEKARVTAGEGDQVTIELSDESVLMHATDFKIVQKARLRLLETMPKTVTPAVVAKAMTRAWKIVADETFRPDTLRVIYYPVLAEASAFYRCIIPSLMLNSRDKVSSRIAKMKVAREALDYDVVVVQLDHSVATRRFCQTLQSMGKKIVFEIDDAFDALEEWHPNYDHFKKSGTQDEIIAMMAAADLVTVTTPYLAERYGKYSKRIAIVPNAITLHDWPKAEPRTGSSFRVLWAGSPSHFGDLAEVSHALETFAKNHKDVRLVFFGREPVGLPDDIKSQVETHPWVEFSEFPPKLAALSADVAIAPLADVKFNYAKSNLRLLQYGATGYPIIASRVGEYARTGEDHCVLAQSAGEWLNALEEMRSNAAGRALMKARSYALAEKYDVSRVAGDIERIYLDLVEKKL